jgi:hypothetical protein
LPVKFLKIADMGHTYDTWGPGMGEQQLVEVEKFLKDGCGAGGL